MIDFKEIYTKYFSDVYKYTLTLCKNDEMAQEITQEAFFKAMRNIEQFTGGCKLYVWLCQIAKNTYFTALKKRKRISQVLDEEMPDITNNIEMNYLDKELAKRLHVLLHNLNEPYKEVFTLRVFGELPFLQIGELFGKSDSWARLTYYRAKKQLQEAMR